MPCENCSAQFSVFKIKRSCSECRRLYCKQCLAKKKDRFLCGRCVILTTRPLSRVDLLQLKPKDLIFYCQSKHISTIGCVEKEELVDLVLAHGNSTQDGHTRSRASGEASDEDNCTNPFDQIKQTCQNFFNTVAEKINNDFNFDLKTSSSFSPRQPASGAATPRQSAPTAPIVNDVRGRASPASEVFSSSYTSSQPASSSASLTSENSRRGAPKAPGHARSCSVDKAKEELSDLHEFEIIQSTTDLTPDAGPSRDSELRPKATTGGNSDSSSSFEELGAVGGSDSFSAVTNNDKSNSETLQISNEMDGQMTSSSEGVQEAANARNFAIFTTRSHPSSEGMSLSASVDSTPVHRSRRLVRRRSDSFIIDTGLLERDISLFLEEETLRKRSRTSSQRGERDREVLRGRLEQFKSEMAALGLSDATIQEQLDAVLKYLEERRMSTTMQPSTSSAAHPPAMTADFLVFTNDNDGINVYPMGESEGFDGIPVINVEKQDSSSEVRTRKYIRLDDITSSAELEKLSVKQLKEILMLNRVDFKGCCEKNELLERVMRLWNDHRTYPSADKLQPDDLCKICMDAPIECVILECGHMATCTNCGKILHECPICRQYIVRVVRFFKA
ncbi:E3 ubiquitin-protein ligase RNF34 [Phlebotomus argentipes]|uniref:E3 ubiquitin-protein ligase RNF34 n=1 Tax=Phlebotomus argentipes TaxID=94469 RepID=UPI0028936B83|nr:E3 ubiquitin-protein ligase RNF34 [Phlebotomus argentipes]